MRVPDEEHVELPAVDADRHPQCHPLSQDVQLPRSPQVPPHGVGGPARPELVLGPGVEQKEGVAPELQKLGPVGVGDSEQADEALVDDRGQLLGPDLAVDG